MHLHALKHSAAQQGTVTEEELNIIADSKYKIDRVGEREETEGKTVVKSKGERKMTGG